MPTEQRSTATAQDATAEQSRDANDYLDHFAFLFFGWLVDWLVDLLAV